MAKIIVGRGTGKQTSMVYKHPGPTQLQDGGYTTKVIPIKEIEEYLKKGWFRNPVEAKKNSTAPEPVKTSDVKQIGKELEKKQVELDSNLKDLEKREKELSDKEKEFDNKEKVLQTGKKK